MSLHGGATHPPKTSQFSLLYAITLGRYFHYRDYLVPPLRHRSDIWMEMPLIDWLSPVYEGERRYMRPAVDHHPAAGGD